MKAILGILTKMVLILLALINITGCDEDSLVSFDGIGYAVVDTGQATCYDNSELIDCPAEGESFYGQDAQYAGYEPSYTDNVDGPDGERYYTYVRVVRDADL